MVWVLTFRSVIHFEVTFAFHVIRGLVLLPSPAPMCWCPVVPGPSVEKTVLFPLLAFVSLSETRCGTQVWLSFFMQCQDWPVGDGVCSPIASLCVILENINDHYFMRGCMTATF